MSDVLQRKVKNSLSDCSLQDRLVTCEIKLKEPTDGSQTEGGETEEAARNLQICSTTADLLRDKLNLPRAG